MCYTPSVSFASHQLFTKVEYFVADFCGGTCTLRQQEIPPSGSLNHVNRCGCLRLDRDTVTVWRARNRWIVGRRKLLRHKWLRCLVTFSRMYTCARFTPVSLSATLQYATIVAFCLYRSYSADWLYVN